MKMRTIDSLYAELKRDDPNTGVTKNALRSLVVSGVIPSVKVGCKYLVSLDAVKTFFGGEVARVD